VASYSSRQYLYIQRFGYCKFPIVRYNSHLNRQVSVHMYIGSPLYFTHKFTTEELPCVFISFYDLVLILLVSAKVYEHYIGEILKYSRFTLHIYILVYTYIYCYFNGDIRLRKIRLDKTGFLSTHTHVLASRQLSIQEYFSLNLCTSPPVSCFLTRT
jgi:hypothetical protein